MRSLLRNYTLEATRTWNHRDYIAKAGPSACLTLALGRALSTDTL